MKTMTNFIDSVITDIEIPNIYNEEYMWAEEYAECYNEYSDMYAGNVYSSSAYQFFGEAAFYQEAHKGLIAGGTLALISGAFFMIMKLLNGGGSGGSSSSSGSNSSSSNKSSKSNNRPPSDPLSDRSTSQPQEEPLQGEKLKAQNDALNTKLKADQEAKAKAAKEKAADKTAEEDKKAGKAAYVKPDELEAEENIVFNAKIIIDELNKLKKQGYDHTNITNGLELHAVLRGLEKIEDVTDYLVGLVRDGNWDIFGSSATEKGLSATEKGYIETFHNECSELHKIVKEIQSKSARINDPNDSASDMPIETVIYNINNIDKVTKSIETKCKEGMRLCKDERAKLINAKKDVSNVDKAYKILNGIIRDVNIVCKNIQNAFKTVHKAAKGKSHPYPLSTSWSNLTYIGSPFDPFENDKDYMMFIKQYSHDITPERIAERSLKALHLCCKDIFYANDDTKISDRLIDKIKNWNSDNQETKTIQTSLNNISKIFNACKKEKPEYSGIYDKVEQVTQKGYELLLDMYKVNPASETLVGKRKSECKDPAFVNLLTYARDYLFDDCPKYKELLNEISNVSTNQKKQDPFTDIHNSNFNDYGMTDSRKLTESIVDNFHIIEGIPDKHVSRFKDGIITLWGKCGKKYSEATDDEELFWEIIKLIRRDIHGSIRRVKPEDAPKIIRFIEAIGFEQAAKVGDDIRKTAKYFDNAYVKETADGKEDWKIATIHVIPFKYNISTDFSADGILYGTCTRYKFESPTGNK